MARGDSAAREGAMKLNAPTQVIYIIALIIAIIALLMVFSVINFIPISAFWVMTIAYVIVAGACLMRGA